MTKPSDDLNKQIKAYVGQVSVDQGEGLSFHVSVDRAQDYAVAIYRLGYYQGDGARLVYEAEGIPAVPGEFPSLDPTTGYVEYNWPASHRVSTTARWVSGVYLAKFTNEDGFQNYATFAVRDDDRPADVLFQRPITTDQAYNNFPNVDPRTAGFDSDNPAHVGKSLYPRNSGGGLTHTETTRASRISFKRPFSGDGSGSLFEWELHQIRWMEMMGYDLAYSTNIDTHRSGSKLKDYKVFVSPAHDEYWTSEMFTAAEEARDSGTNLAFFGANSVYWQVRLEDDLQGNPHQVLASYKKTDIDPEPDAALKTKTFRHVGRAEQQLVGVQYVGLGGNVDYVAANTDHWAYGDTGLSDGSTVKGITGYEIDALVEDAPKPVSLQHTILSSSPYVDSKGNSWDANTSLYQAPSGAWVFASGTMSWAWALDKEGYVNRGIQRMTANLMDRFLGSDEPPADACGGLAHEAEDGELSGRFTVGTDEAASAGRDAGADQGSGDSWSGRASSHRALYCFTVDQAGAYRLKGAVYAPSDESDSFFVAVNDQSGDGYVWLLRQGQTYESDYVNHLGEDVVLSLEAGTHTVVVSVREDGARLDTLELEPVPEASTPTCSAGQTQSAAGAVVTGAMTLVGADDVAYLLAPDRSGNHWSGPTSVTAASFCLTVEEAGTYGVVVDARADEGTSNSFFVTVDSRPETGALWDVPIAGIFTESYATGRGEAWPLTVELEPGEHRIRFHLREDGSMIRGVSLEPWASPFQNCSASLTRKAEDGVLRGAVTVLHDARTSDGQAIGTAEDGGRFWLAPSPHDAASYCFDVPAAGAYVLSAQVAASSSRDDSYYVSLNGDLPASAVWDLGRTEGYVDRVVRDSGAPGPNVFRLNAGRNVIALHPREDGARLDSVTLRPVD